MKTATPGALDLLSSWFGGHWLGQTWMVGKEPLQILSLGQLVPDAPPWVKEVEVRWLGQTRSLPLLLQPQEIRGLPLVLVLPGPQPPQVAEGVQALGLPWPEPPHPHPGLGLCGLVDQEGKETKRLLMEAAQARQVSKARRLAGQDHKSPLDWEETLFALMLRALGYQHHSQALEGLAQIWPYQSLQGWLAQGQTGQGQILARWWHRLGFLGQWSGPEIQPELQGLWQAWLELAQPGSSSWPPPLALPRLASRPQNHPFRRLLGLAHHLQTTAKDGLFKAWLRFFYQAGAILDQKKPLPLLLEALDRAFASPQDDPFLHWLLPNSKKPTSTPRRLIGQDRQLVVLINGIMPLFLLWAEQEGQKEVEKILFALFLVLPGEGGNHKTQAMEQHLWSLRRPAKLVKNLAYYQGLIQLHDDFCHSFAQGCQGCKLPQRLLG